MTTLTHAATTFQVERDLYATCDSCGDVYRRDESCGWCAADRRLADALASLKAIDDYDAFEAAAGAIESAVADWPLLRARRERARRVQRVNAYKPGLSLGVDEELPD